MLAKALAAKRKQPSSKDDDIFSRANVEVIQSLLDNNTRTSRRKLKRLGVLTDSRGVADVQREVQEYLKLEKEAVEEDLNEENQRMKGVSSSRNRDSLMNSLARQHRQLAAVLRAEGEDFVEDALLEDDSSSPEYSEDIKDDHMASETVTAPDATHKDKAAVILDTLKQQQDYFETHMEREADDIDESEIQKKYKNLDDVSDIFQNWESNSVVVQSSEDARLPDGVSSRMEDYAVRQRLALKWKELHPKGNAYGDFASKKQATLFSLMNAYLDINYCIHPYPTDAVHNDPTTDAALLHILNHVAQSAERIKKNNEKLKSLQQNKKEIEDIPRDQGFVRPKVLILLPFRNLAYTLVNRLIALAITQTRTDTVQNKERFLSDFGPEDEQNALMSDRAKRAVSLKPAQHQAMFQGNYDDHFRLGIKLTRGCIRLYRDFFDSDIIVASPLGLATKLEEDKKERKTDDTDYLSSIEIMFMARADVIQMQNWAHVSKIMESLNNIPLEQHNIDIMRLREWYVSGKARSYRQNIVLSSFPSPALNALFSKQCSNHAGLVKWTKKYSGILVHIVQQLKHTFEPLDKALSSAVDDADARFEYFKSSMWPRIRDASRGGGQLLYVPSYFDYVKVRNYLREQAASFVGLCEYTDPKDMSRARSYFLDGRRRVLVYTERAQFFNRHRIRGIKDVYFFQLPEHPQFYAEIGNFIEEGDSDGTITVAFSKFDLLRLERIVGTEKARLMVKRGKSGSAAGTFVFC